ncbi:MAG: hypothetical protein NZ929_05850 [Aigarchaeota archaeon]|nr:hypothetical protein [Aigarchaeota archaeon]MDW7986891.1 hypothetical protein [Nitrososphaerota archaeon]
MKVVQRVEKIKNAEALLLDCDGTIIDTSMSYDLAIKLSTIIILDKVFNVEIKLGKEVERTLNAFRMAGGFNNDCDSASAIIQTLTAFLPETVEFNKDEWKIVQDVDGYLRLIGYERSYPEFVSTALDWLTSQLILRKEYLDLKKVEEMINEKAAFLRNSSKLSKLRSFLNYPGNFGLSLLATLFDELFLGSKGVREKYNWEPRYVIYDGTLVNERVLISEESMIELSKIFDECIGLITGRGRWETEKTLAPFLKYLNMEASIFTADKGLEYEKPSPRALIEVAKILKTNKLLYVGNAMEDLLMSLSASREGLEVGFIGVANTGEKAREFQLRGADAIIHDINELPSLIKDLQ